MNKGNKEEIDLAGGDAGSAAVASAAAKLAELGFGEDSPAPPRAPAAAPVAEEEEESPNAAEVDAEVAPPLEELVLPERPAPVEVPAHVARKGTKSIETWKALHAELATKEAALADMERDRLLKEQEIQELNKKLAAAPPEDEIKGLKQKLQEQEDFIGRIDVTKSKVFQEKYDEPLRQTFAKLVQTFIRSGRDERQAVELARSVFRPGLNDPAELEKALPGDASAVLVGAVSAILDDREALVAKREEALRDWRSTRAADQAEETRRQLAESSSVLSRAGESAFDAVVKDGSWLYQRGQDPKWNEGVEARRAAAIGYLRNGKPEDIARLVLEGVASPTYRKQYEQLKGKYDELLGKYNAIATRGRPSITPRPAEQAGAAPAEAPSTLEGYVDQNWEE